MNITDEITTLTMNITDEITTLSWDITEKMTTKLKNVSTEEVTKTYNTEEINTDNEYWKICAQTIGSSAIVLVHVLAIFLILKCRNIPTSVKFLVTNLCLIDIIGAAWGCVRVFIRLSYNNEKVRCMMDIFFVTSTFNVSALLVSAIAIDRYISVFLPLKYVTFVTKRLLATVCSVSWVSGVFLAILSLLIDLDYSEEYGCQLRMSLKEFFPWFMVLMRLLCLIIIALTHSRMFWKIHSVGKKYNPWMKRGELRCLAKILLIVTPHLILHVHYIVVFFLRTSIDIQRALDIEIHLTVIVILIDPFIFVFRFKECRINLAIIACYCSRKYRDERIKERTYLYGTYLDCKKPYLK